MPETLESSAPQQRRSWTVSEWPVVRKVALVLAIPLLLAVVLGGLRVQSELTKASAATATSSQVTVLGPAVDYLSASEDAAMVFRGTDDEQERSAALRSVNDASSRLEMAWSQADLSEDQRAQVRSLLASTQDLRDGSAYAVVSTAVNQLKKLETEVTLNIATMTDAGTSTESLIGLVGQLNEGRLAVTEQQLLLIQGPSVIPKNELYGHLGVESAAIGNLERLLPDDPSVSLLRNYNNTNTGLLGIGTPDLKAQQPLRVYDELSTDLLGQIEATLAADAAASNRTALLTAALTALALLIAIGLAVLISRILVRPIQRVRDGALEVAHERLPETVRRIRAGEDPGEIEPIAVTTHEEMGQLARAVDDLHGTAVRLAQDEAELRSRVADMFVTLSRRNTSLVNQQLRLIEKLETDEEDPQRLESLFQLDHLASRMRRTAESLVVLADAPSQHSEQEALSVDEALHAATAGVQDYQRVDVSGAPSLRISGSGAPDVVHLFTELIDNALTFSPPSTRVRVTTTTPAGLVLVEVSDAGLGIDHETLLELNHTLRVGAEVGAGTARRMGLFVVARLARRHGLTVSLERNVEGGTTAKVFVPRPLLTHPDSPALAAAPSPVPSRVPSPVPEVSHDHEEAPVPTVVHLTEAAEVPEVDEPVRDEPVPAVSGTMVNLDTLAAVINANIRLPQRQPGTAAQPEPLTPVLPQRAPVPDPVAFRPVAEPQAVAPEVDEPEPRPDREADGTPVIELIELVEPVEPAEQVEAVVLELVEELVEEPVTRSVLAGPLSPLDDPRPAYALDAHDDDDETPMFRALRSGWFSSAGDSHAWDAGGVDAGWQAADRATDAAPSRLTRSGLPVRDPGHRLVPGGVVAAAPVFRRDPEAIKARLSAHAAGVARGRSVAGSPCPDRSTDTIEDVTP